MRIYNLGSLNLDYVYSVEHFLTAGETLSSNGLRTFPGGKGLNQSVALSRAGAKVIHGGLVGDNSELLTDTLSQAGVDIQRIQKISSKSGHTIIQVDKSGQNCILLYPGANGAVDQAYIERFLSDGREGDILLLQNEISGLEAAFEIAHAKKMQIAFNPSPYHENILKLPLSYVKWWFCNEIEAQALFESSIPQEIADAFLKRYPHSQLILTLGEKGSVFVDANTCISQPIYPVQAVDTTAAGDTFTGYFLAAWVGGKDVAYALEIAAKAAGIAVSRHGASASIPFLKEVLDETM